MLIMPYKAEIKDGLGEALAQCSIAYVSQLHPAPKSFLTQSVVDKFQLTLAENTDFDLYPVYDIMVSTGWNQNDDVFLGQYVYEAKATPKDKPFNLLHKPRQILGHIIDNTLVDVDLNEIGEVTAMDGLPAHFHLLSKSVLYKHLSSRDNELTQEVAELIEGIEKNEWFVSMEALFTAFDYAVKYKSGEEQIITRDSTTAGLTKHLRIYKGDGEYNGGHLGRVLKNITFSGKGLVTNPANPESVILNNTKTFVGANFGVKMSDASSLDNNVDSNIVGVKKMTENEKYVANLETQVEALKADLAKASARIEELGEAGVKSAMADKDAEISSLNEKLASLQASVDEANAKLDEANKAKADLDKQVAEANDKLTAIADESRKTSRISTLVDKGVDKAEAEVVVAEFDDLSDEKFARVVAMQAAIVEAKKAAKPDEEMEEEEKAKKAKADAEKDEHADETGETTAEQTDLESQEVEADVNLSTDNVDNSQAELMTSLAEFLDTAMHTKK